MPLPGGYLLRHRCEPHTDSEQCCHFLLVFITNLFFLADVHMELIHSRTTREGQFCCYNIGSKIEIHWLMFSLHIL
jgi:hypothetical protein